MLKNLFVLIFTSCLLLNITACSESKDDKGEQEYKKQSSNIDRVR